MDDETKTNVEELQALERHLQNLVLQKQAMQVEINEIDNALEEMKNSGDEVYKVISGAMLKTDKEKIKKELKEKKKILEMKAEAIEKQEKLTEKKAEDLRKDVETGVSKKK